MLGLLTRLSCQCNYIIAIMPGNVRHSPPGKPGVTAGSPVTRGMAAAAAAAERAEAAGEPESSLHGNDSDASTASDEQPTGSRTQVPPTCDPPNDHWIDFDKQSPAIKKRWVHEWNVLDMGKGKGKMDGQAVMRMHCELTEALMADIEATWKLPGPGPTVSESTWLRRRGKLLNLVKKAEEAAEKWQECISAVKHVNKEHHYGPDGFNKGTIWNQQSGARRALAGRIRIWEEKIHERYGAWESSAGTPTVEGTQSRAHSPLSEPFLDLMSQQTKMAEEQASRHEQMTQNQTTMIQKIATLFEKAAVKKPLVIRDNQKFLPDIKLSHHTSFTDAEKFWRQWHTYANETLRDESEASRVTYLKSFMTVEFREHIEQVEPEDDTVAVVKEKVQAYMYDAVPRQDRIRQFMNARRKFTETPMEYYVRLDNLAKAAGVQTVSPEDIKKYTFFMGLNPSTDAELLKRIYRSERNAETPFKYRDLRDFVQEYEALQHLSRSSSAAAKRQNEKVFAIGQFDHVCSSMDLPPECMAIVAEVKNRLLRPHDHPENIPTLGKKMKETGALAHYTPRKPTNAPFPAYPLKNYEQDSYIIPPDIKAELELQPSTFLGDLCLLSHRHSVGWRHLLVMQSS